MKYAVVTGSTRGIGFEIAQKLINSGYYVFINGRSHCNLNLPEGSYRLIEADISSESGVSFLVQEIMTVTNHIECLVLNAGATCRKSMIDTTLDDWLFIMNTNVNMPYLIVNKLMPYISNGGNILFISSAMALKPHATSLPYGVSKAAINALAQGLVKEVASRNVRVNSICPGFVDTEWQKEKPQWLREKITSKIALKRFAEPSEIADMCLKVMENQYVNGAIISIDGGYDMQ